MQWLAQIHSVLRWPVLLLGFAAAAKYAISLARNSPFTRADSILGTLFASALDAQALVGVVLLGSLLLREGDLPPTNRILHAGTMFFALAAAHQTARWSGANPARRFRNGLIAYTLAIVLILLGILVILQGG